MTTSGNAPNQSMKPTAKRAVGPVDLPRRISTSPDAGDATYDALRNGPLSERGSQSARTRAQRPSSARASSHLRRYSHPPGVVMPGYHAPSFYQPTPTSVRSGHPYGGGADSGEYGSSAALAAAWSGGMAPLPVFGPWGYEMGWGPHPGTAAGMYGVCVLGAAQSRKSEKPTRIIFVGGLPSSLDESKIQELAEAYGPIRGLDTTQRESSSGVFVSYYDVRHAQAAVKGLPDVVAGLARGPSRDGQSPRGVAYFMLPPVGVPGMENQGIIAVSGGDELSTADLKAIFAKHGELKSVSKATSGSDHRLVEFFDTRDAERAMAELKGRKAPAGAKLEYAPFAGLEPAFPPSYQMYTHPPGYLPPNGLKHDDSGIQGGLDAGSAGAGPAMWPFGVQPPTPFGWAPYPMQPPHGNFGSEGSTPVGTSTAMPAASSVELPAAMGDAGAGTYVLPQNCRTDYYAPQYMGYPHGMPAMLPFGPGGQPMTMMQAPGMYDGAMNGMRNELPNSPVHGSNGSEQHGWRPHRTGRGCGERSYDPAQFEFNLDEAHTKSANARTTLMIRNIPNKYSQKMLLDVLDRKYRGRYDFFYLPIDFKNRCNLGYAFVNFKDASTTAEFYKELHSKSWEEFNSKKVCEITYARVQGRNALIEHFRNSRFPCNEPDYLPLVFEPVDEVSQNKTTNQPVMKATPVHHWTSLHYPNNPVVAAH